MNLDTASVFGSPLEEPLAAKCRSAVLPGVPRAPPAAPRLAARPIGVARNDPHGAHLGSISCLVALMVLDFGRVINLT